MPSALIRASLAIFVVTTCACSSDADKKPAAGGTTPPASSPASTAQPAPAQAKKGRDITTLRACDIVTAAEAAKVTGGSLLNTPGNTGPVCIYVVDVKDTTESYQLAFRPVELMESWIQAQSEADRGEKVEGPWDEAYIERQTLGTGFVVTGLRRGDVAFEVKGERREPVLELARLGLSRVPK